MTGLPGAFPVEVFGVATRDRHGDETRAPLGTIDGCSFAPGESTEDTDKRAQVVTKGELYVPVTDIAVAVTAQQRIRFPDGREWTVGGEPQWWSNPYTGTREGGVIALQRVTG